jgi:hypothetical protein
MSCAILGDCGEEEARAMKLSEYQAELDSLLIITKQLNARLDMQRETTMWLVRRTDEICEKIDALEETENYTEKERLMAEALELAGRLTVETKAIEKDTKLDREIKERSRRLDLRKLNEGLEMD